VEEWLHLSRPWHNMELTETSSSNRILNFVFKGLFTNIVESPLTIKYQQLLCVPLQSGTAEDKKHIAGVAIT
jgi:hypothetical protein